MQARITRLCRKIHRWGGLLLAAFVIFYSLTGLLLNHRRYFQYFTVQEKTAHAVPVLDAGPLQKFIAACKAQIKRDEDPKVIRIRPDRTIEFLYGSHGKTTYVIDPRNGRMEKIEKIALEPVSWLNDLHKAAKTGKGWLLFSDACTLLLLLTAISGLVAFRYRLADYLLVLGGVALLFAGMMLA